MNCSQLKLSYIKNTFCGSKEGSSGTFNMGRYNWVAFSGWHTRQLPVDPISRKLIELWSSFIFVFHSKLRRSWAIMRRFTPRLCRYTGTSFPWQMYKRSLSWRLKLGLCRKPGSKEMICLWKGRLSLKLSIRYVIKTLYTGAHPRISVRLDGAVIHAN